MPAEKFDACIDRLLGENGVHVQLNAPPRPPVVICTVAGRLRARTWHEIAAGKAVALGADLTAGADVLFCVCENVLVIHIHTSNIMLT